jgi:hypothetical protein
MQLHSIRFMRTASGRPDRGRGKLTKRKSRGRIDGAVALAMAIGAAPGGWTGSIDVAALIG